MFRVDQAVGAVGGGSWCHGSTSATAGCTAAWVWLPVVASRLPGGFAGVVAYRVRYER
jgi:hypothetical protein